mgnify:FL=1
MLQSKLPKVGINIFSQVSKLANEYQAINLGQGFPDYSMNPELTACVNEAMKNGYNQYTPMEGYMPLRNVIAEKVNKAYGCNVQPTINVTITPGGTYAIYCAITAIINPGDEVIVFEPAYDSYVPNIELNGGKVVPVKLEHPSYAINWDLVETVISNKTRLIIINTPHNPSGSILSANDMEQLAKIIEGKDIYIVSDEVYEHLIFDNHVHESVLKYPALASRAFVCFSFGKLFDCTGWKIGYCIAPENLSAELRKIHQYNCFSVNSAMQAGIANFMQHNSSYTQINIELQKKRDLLRRLMKENTPFELLASKGTYFELYSYAHLSDLSDVEMVNKLIKECGVAAIPASAFYSNAVVDNKVIRLCFAKKESTLMEAAQRLKQFEEYLLM